MKRNSSVTKHSDSAGDYEQEVFECDSPKQIIIGIHGNGVRRWDGEEFYYQLAEHFTDSVVMLVDQNQVEADGCKLNSLDIMAERNQKVIDHAKKSYPKTPLWIIAHSMGCGIASLLDLESISGLVFVSPGVGKQLEKYIERYGADIVNGKIVQTSDGLTKNISKEFMDSASKIYWQESYLGMLSSYSPVHVFESGDDEIVDNERFKLRSLPFTSYRIIKGAKHNFSGKHSDELFSKIDSILTN